MGRRSRDRAYALTHPDPYSNAARAAVEMGHRLPSPFQAPQTMGRRDPASQLGLPPSVYADMHSPASVFSTQSVAGVHETYAGSVGRVDPTPVPWDARHRMGYAQLGTRGAGYSDQWDTPQGRERTGGRLTKTGKFDQNVRTGLPYLQLRARSDLTQGPVDTAEAEYEGNALIRVTAGNFQDGQGVQRRTFWLGGGFVAVFDLMGWNNVTINILEILDGTFVEFAWTKEGLHGDNRTLYYPQRYTTAAKGEPVPEGAYALAIENPLPATAGNTATVEWIGRLNGSPFTFSQNVSDNANIPASPRPYAFYGSPITTYAPTFRITHGSVTSFDLVWLLRPI